MCLLIYKKKNKTINKNNLLQAFLNNSDGAGFSFIENKKIKIIKWFFDFDLFYNSYMENKIDEKEAIVHFRFATHWIINKANCHPFNIHHDPLIVTSEKVTSDFVFAHNGIIYNEPKKEKPKKKKRKWKKNIELLSSTFFNTNKNTHQSIFSDTVGYIANTFSKYNINNLDIEKIKNEIGGSKLVIMWVNKTVIINEELWNRKDDVRYSNESYLPTPPYYGGEIYENETMYYIDHETLQVSDNTTLITLSGQSIYLKAGTYYIYKDEPIFEYGENWNEYGIENKYRQCEL